MARVVQHRISQEGWGLGAHRAGDEEAAERDLSLLPGCGQPCSTHSTQTQKLAGSIFKDRRGLLVLMSTSSCPGNAVGCGKALKEQTATYLLHHFWCPWAKGELLPSRARTNRAVTVQCPHGPCTRTAPQSPQTPTCPRQLWALCPTEPCGSGDASCTAAMPQQGRSSIRGGGGALRNASTKRSLQHLRPSLQGERVYKKLPCVDELAEIAVRSHLRTV